MSQPLLSASSILGAVDLKEEIVPVPEWPNTDGSPGTIHLREMTALRQIDMMKIMHVKENEDDGMFIILIFSAIDAEGNPLFTMEDLPALRKKNFNVINRLQKICLLLNKDGVQSEVALKKD